MTFHIMHSWTSGDGWWEPGGYVVLYLGFDANDKQPDPVPVNASWLFLP